MSIATHSIESSTIIDILKEHDLIVDVSPSIFFDSVTYDSRDVKHRSLFICKGFGFKSEYLKMAIAKGATAYMSEKDFDETIPSIIVKDVRKAMSLVAMEVYENCYRNLTLIGLTGTKGKTTTTYFIHNILNSYIGKKTGILSTVERYLGNKSEEAHLTTPESLDLHACFKEALENDVKYITMEVSSQAYKLNRVYGMKFNYGMFINIGVDHIGPMEHEDFNDYFNCKLEFVKNCGTMIINRDTDYYDTVKQIADQHCENIITYGLSDDCDFKVDNIVKTKTGFTFEVFGLGWQKKFVSNMSGRFNIENALGAIAISKIMGIDDKSIYEGVQNTSVMGRMNVFDGKDITVIVDYAHNFVSFSKLYQSLKSDYQDRRLVVVGGCPGGKAHLRRKDIGTLTGENADFMYLTAEDPQFEDVKDICNDIASHLHGTPYEIIPDREMAIKQSIVNAKAGDVVLLAGKGEEMYQKIRGEYIPYPSDYLLAKKYLTIRDNGEK